MSNQLDQRATLLCRGFCVFMNRTLIYFGSSAEEFAREAYNFLAGNLALSKLKPDFYWGISIIANEISVNGKHSDKVAPENISTLVCFKSFVTWIIKLHNSSNIWRSLAVIVMGSFFKKSNRKMNRKFKNSWNLGCSMGVEKWTILPRYLSLATF